MNWNDPKLRVKSDPAWRAQYRRLQSWYRETALGVPPGRNAAGMLLGSMLPADAVESKPGLNFIDPSVTDYAERRIAEVQRANGTIEVDRLRRNMLSSMPLCFNLFGYLRARPSDAAAVLGSLLALDIASIDELECEWAPARESALNDRTAFDAFVAYRTRRGERGFLGIETKYTEPFSTTEYEAALYSSLTDAPGSGFVPGAAATLKGKATNQLWRNALLALQLRKSEPSFTHAHVLVVACASDEKAKKAVEGVRKGRVQGDDLIRFLALEPLMDAFESRPATGAWAREFRRRYLDLTPVG